MTASSVLALIKPVSADTPETWTMVAHRHLCLGPEGGKHQSGGATLASVITVLEQLTARPLIQAHVQFLGSPHAEQGFEIALSNYKIGRNISHAIARVTRGAHDLAIVSASLGSREDVALFSWEAFPAAPPPEACPRVPFGRQSEGDLHAHLDIRLALDPRNNPQGRAQFWVHTDTHAPVSAAFVALIADYLPEAIHMNIARPAGAVSLDNMVRIVRTAATPWLLCDIQLSAIYSGIFHGRMAIFTQAGQLVATASQSGVVTLF